ncbi:zf-HC2 domain-containing protein [Streptomyces sp. URMC 129]|uniref:zf-HC2 domain-containing protein n=1 Tax=Streptomyces sp. URMC 129 TaxID=3423407 RepID=UPI003F1CEE3E
MQCIRYRTAISARAQNAPLPEGLSEQDLDTHLTACLECRRWSNRLRTLRETTEDLLRRRRAGSPPKPV